MLVIKIKAKASVIEILVKIDKVNQNNIPNRPKINIWLDYN